MDFSILDNYYNTSNESTQEMTMTYPQYKSLQVKKKTPTTILHYLHHFLEAAL